MQFLSEGICPLKKVRSLAQRGRQRPRPAIAPGQGSFAVIAIKFLIGLALTIRHEVYADNVQ